MPEAPAARPEFTGLAEAEVWDALEHDTDGKVAAEVTRLIASYTLLMKACAARHGPVPPEVLHVSVRWPIERVAVLMLVMFLQSEGRAAVSRFSLH